MARALKRAPAVSKYKSRGVRTLEGYFASQREHARWCELKLLVPALQPLFDRFDAAGGDHRVLLPVLGVDRAYLTTALTQMSASYGTIEGYFTAGLGLDASTIDRLRDAFTQTSPPT